MPDCKNLPQCDFFSSQLRCLPRTAGQLYETYCQGDYSRCARFQLSSAGVMPPKDLYPNELKRAAQILKSNAAVGLQRT